MFRAAAWVIDQEMKAVEWLLLPEVDPKDKLYLQMAVVMSSSPVWGSVAMTPYYSLNRAASAASWAVDDITGPVGKRTFYNYAPRTRAFAARGGGRFLATRVGARFSPIVGWALFAYDMWSVGKWIGEKTSPW